MAEFPIDIISAKEYHIPEPEETETSFAGNAKLKAEFCAQYSKISALADDSGLCIHALDNQPHIYSARLAKEQGGFAQAMRYLYEQLTLKNSQISPRILLCTGFCRLSTSLTDLPNANF